MFAPGATGPWLKLRLRAGRTTPKIAGLDSSSGTTGRAENRRHFAANSMNEPRIISLLPAATEMVPPNRVLEVVKNESTTSARYRPGADGAAG